jgi:hypothetical protein
VVFALEMEGKLKTYKELRDGFFEEVSKIDVSKLSLMSFGGSYKEYAELLKSMAEIPLMSKEEEIKARGLDLCCCETRSFSTPKIEEGGK